MSELFEVAEKKQWKDDDWLKARESIHPIVFQ
jgi:hypothetical protein